MHAILFPKKTGASLSAAAPHVNEVYEGFYYLSKRNPDSHNTCPFHGRRIGKLLHITFHALPEHNRTISLVLLLGYFSIWLSYPLSTKLLTTACALVYSCMEYTFTTIERSKGYTSFAQFFSNIIYIPVLLMVYPHFITSRAVYVLFFPMNIYALEIIQHFLIIKPIWGFNAAWNYKDYSDELLGGVIRTGHAPAWWGLGVICWLFVPALRELFE